MIQDAMDAQDTRRRGPRKKIQQHGRSNSSSGHHRCGHHAQRIHSRTRTCVAILLLMIVALATSVQGACIDPAKDCVTVSAPTLMRHSATDTDVHVQVANIVSASIAPVLTLSIAISLAGATVDSTGSSYSFQPVVGAQLKPLRAASTLLMQRLDLTFSLSGNSLYELSDTVLTVWVLPSSYPVSTLLGGAHAIGNFFPANASAAPISVNPVLDAQGVLRPSVGFRGVEGLVQDPQGVYLYIADTGNHCVRRLHRATMIMDVLLGTPGSPGNASDPNDPRMVYPSALVMDSLGEFLYIADRGRCRIQRMHAATLAVSIVLASEGCDDSTGTYSGQPLSNGLFGMTLNRADSQLWVVDGGPSSLQLVSIDLTAGGGSGPFTPVLAPFSFSGIYSVALDEREENLFIVDPTSGGIGMVNLLTNALSQPVGAGLPWTGGSNCWGVLPQIKDGSAADACFGDIPQIHSILRSADGKTLYVANGPGGLRAVDIDDAPANAANLGRVTTVSGRVTTAPLYLAQQGGSAGGLGSSVLFMNLVTLALDFARPGWLLGYDRTTNTIMSMDPATGLGSPLIHSGGEVPGGGHCAFALGDADGVAADASFFSGTGMAAAPLSATGVFAGKMLVADHWSLSLVNLTTLEKTRVWSSMSYSVGLFRYSTWSQFGLADVMATSADPQMAELAFVGPAAVPVTFVATTMFAALSNTDATVWTDTVPAGLSVSGSIGGLAGAQTTDTLYIAHSFDCQILSLSLATPTVTTSLTGDNLGTGLRCGRAAGLSLVQDVAAADLALQNIVDLALDEPANLLYILQAPPQREWATGAWPATPLYAGANATGDALLLALNVVTNRAAIVTGVFDSNSTRDCTPLDGVRGVARLCNPTSMALSLSKSFLFLADAIWTGATYASVIRQVHLPSGTVVTVAGSASQGGCVDAPQSTFPLINTMTIANNGQLYVVGNLDAKIRTVLLSDTCFPTSVSPTIGSATPTLVLSGTFAVPPTAVTLVCADPSFPTSPISCTGISGSITAISCTVFTPLQGAGLCPDQKFIIQITSAALQLTTPIIYSVLSASAGIVSVSPNTGSLKTGVTTVTLLSATSFANSAADIVDVRYQKNGIGTLRPCVGGFKTLSIARPLATNYTLGQITDVECGVDAASAPELLDYLQFTITVGSVAQPSTIVGAVAPATVFTVIRGFVLERFDVAGQTFVPAFQSGTLHIHAAEAFPFNVQPNLPSGAQVVTLDCGAGPDFVCNSPTAVSSTQISCTLPFNIPPSDCTIHVSVGGDSAQLTSPPLQIGNRLVLTNVQAQVAHNQVGVAILSVTLLHNLLGNVVLTLSTASAGITIATGSVTTNFLVAPSALPVVPLAIDTDSSFQSSALVTLTVDGATDAAALSQFPSSDLVHAFPLKSLKATSVVPAGSYFELQPGATMSITMTFLEVESDPGFIFIDMYCGVTPALSGAAVQNAGGAVVRDPDPTVWAITPPPQSGVSYSCEYVLSSGDEYVLPPITVFKVLSDNVVLDYVGGSCGGLAGVFQNFTVGADPLPSLFVGSLLLESPCQIDVRAQWPTATLNYTVLNSTLGGPLTFGSTPYLYLPPGNSTVLLSIVSESGAMRTVTILVSRLAEVVVVPVVGSFSVSALPTLMLAGASASITLGVPVFNTITAMVQLICADVVGPASLAGVVAPSAVQSIVSPSSLLFTLTAPNPPPATASSDLFCRWELVALGLTLPPFFFHVQSIDHSLASLSGNCLPAGSTAFAPGTLVYTSTVAWNLEACSLTAVATSGRSVVSFGAGVVNATAAGSSRSGSLALIIGVNSFTLSVTSESGEWRNISVSITRVAEIVGSFSLSGAPGSLVRAGAVSTLTLGVPVFNSITATVQLICSQVNGSTALSGVVTPSAVQTIVSPSPLSFTLTIPNPPPATASSDLFCRWELFALGLTLPPFHFHVQSIDTSLSALFGTCLPAGSTAFAPGTLAYTSSLPFLAASCNLTAVVNSAMSSHAFGVGAVNVSLANTTLSGGIDLVVGINVLTVSITAESGDVQTITVTITRASDVYVAPGLPPVLTVTVAPSINPCDTVLNPCSPFGSVCHSTANISTVDPTADVQKLMSCSCNTGFSGETCDLGIVGCPQCVTSMKGNTTMQLLVVGAQWIRRIVVGGLDMDFNATERVYPSDQRFRTAMDAPWPSAVKALPYFTLITFVSPALSTFTTPVTTQSRSASSFASMAHSSHAPLLFDVASNVTLVNPRSHYQSASIDAVFAGKFRVERTEYRRLWYSSSDCLKVGEMRPDGQGGCLCPEGCFCPGGGRCWPQAGYWSATETQIPIACRIADTCPGTGTNPSLQPTGGNAAQTQTSNCAAGYSGIACASCSDGYYGLSDRCYACGSDADQTQAFVTIVIGAACITIGLALAVAFLHAAQLVLVVTFVVVLQSIVTVGQQGARDLPGATGSTLAAVFSYMSVINFDLSATRPGCTVPSLTFIDLFWATIALICVTALLFFLACCLRFLFRLRHETDDARIVAEKQLALEKSLKAADEAMEKEEIGRQKSRELRRQKSVKSGRKLLDVDLMEDELDEEETKEQIRKHLKRTTTLAAHHFHTPPREDFKRRVLHSFLLLCSIFYLKLNTLQFKMFVCVTAPTPDTVLLDNPIYAEFLKEDYQTPCYASAHLGTTISICLLFIFYSFLFPFATYVILCRAFADEAEETGCTSWLVRHFRLFRPSQSKDEQAEEAQRAMRKEDQHHKQIAKNALVDAKVEAGVTRVAGKADTAPASRSTSFAVLPLSTAMTLAYIEHHRMQTFGFLFLHIRHAVFPYRLTQYVVNFCFAAITTQVTRIDVQLFLLGFCFVVEALIVAWFLPFETMADNALHGGLDMLLLSHTAVMLSVQSGGEHMTLFFTLVALFGALLVVIALRGPIAEWFKDKARMKRSLSKYRGEQSVRGGLIELGRVGTMALRPRGSPSRSPERSRVAFVANADSNAVEDVPAVRMHHDPLDAHDENAVARFEAPLSPSNNGHSGSDPSTPPPAATAQGGGRVFVHRDTAPSPSGDTRVLANKLEAYSPLRSESISSPSPGHGCHDSNASDDMVGQGATQSAAPSPDAAAAAAHASAAVPRKSHSGGSRGNSTPNSARTPHNPASAAATPQPASPAGVVTPHRSPSVSPKIGPLGGGGGAATTPSMTPDGTPKQAPRGILVGAGKVTRGQPRALAIETTTVHNLAVGSAATTAWSASAGSASAGATSAGVVAGGVAAASVPSSPQRTVSYKRTSAVASASGSPPAINRTASVKRGILRSPPPTLAVGDDSSPATGSPVANSAATLAWRAKRLGRDNSTPASPLTASAPRSRFGSERFGPELAPETPAAVDAGMTFGETPKVGPLDDAGGISGFLPGTPHAAGSPGSSFGFSPLLRPGHGSSEQTAGESMDAMMLTGGSLIPSNVSSPPVAASAVTHGSSLSPPTEFGTRSPGYSRTVSAAAKRSTLMSSVLQQGVLHKEDEDDK